MLNEQGKVIETDGKTVMVEIDAATACKGCQGCQAGSCAKRIVKTESDEIFRKGETVTLSVSTSAALASTFLCYGVPALSMLFGALLTQYVFKLPDPVVAVTSIICAALPWFFLRKAKVKKVTITKPKSDL